MERGRKIFLFIVLIEIGFLFGWGLKVEQDINRVDEKLQRMRGEIRQIEEKNQNLQSIIDKKINDPFFREKLAREKLGLARKGEVVYKIVPRERLPSSE